MPQEDHSGSAPASNPLVSEAQPTAKTAFNDPYSRNKCLARETLDEPNDDGVACLCLQRRDAPAPAAPSCRESESEAEIRVKERNQALQETGNAYLTACVTGAYSFSFGLSIQ